MTTPHATLSPIDATGQVIATTDLPVPHGGNHHLLLRLVAPQHCVYLLRKPQRCDKVIVVVELGIQAPRNRL